MGLCMASWHMEIVGFCGLGGSGPQEPFPRGGVHPEAAQTPKQKQRAVLSLPTGGCQIDSPQQSRCAQAADAPQTTSTGDVLVNFASELTDFDCSTAAATAETMSNKLWSGSAAKVEEHPAAIVAFICFIAASA